MPLLQKHVSPLWGIWKIEESWQELLCQFEQPQTYLPFLDQRKSESRKAEWLAVRLLLKELTGTETAVSYRDNGAPYLPDSSFYISISHTKGYAAVLLSHDKPVGIDIEYYSERVHRINSRFLNENEIKLLGENPTTNELLVCWSAKETVFKLTEQKTADLQKDIQIIDFKPSESKNNGFLTVIENLTPQSSVFQINYLITPDFVVTRSE
jgi:phosphopantetheinyl transferase